MNTKINFKTFEIKGKNVSNTLKKFGITKVPSLYFPDKKGCVEGYQNIARYLGVEHLLQSPHHQQPITTRKRKKKKKTKPKLEPKYQKALLDSDDEFERRFKEAHQSDNTSLSTQDNEQDEESFQEESFEDEESFQEEESFEDEEEEWSDSDEVSLEV